MTFSAKSWLVPVGNFTKVTPVTGSASGSQAIPKKLKVTCGANTSYLADTDWIGDKTSLTLDEVRVSLSNSVKPNIGASELAEARLVGVW